MRSCSNVTSQKSKHLPWHGYAAHRNNHSNILLLISVCSVPVPWLSFRNVKSRALLVAQKSCYRTKGKQNQTNQREISRHIGQFTEKQEVPHRTFMAAVMRDQGITFADNINAVM